MMSLTLSENSGCEHWQHRSLVHVNTFKFDDY